MSDMMCVCVQLEPSAHAVPLVDAVVALTLTTIMTPRSATLETSISASGDSSTLVFASTTSAEVENGLMFEVHWYANKVEPITTVSVVPLMKQTSIFANSVLCTMDRSAVAVVPVGPNSSGLLPRHLKNRPQEGENSPLPVDLFGRKVDIVLVGRGFLPRPQHISMRHLFRQRTRHLEGRKPLKDHRNR